MSELIKLLPDHIANQIAAGEVIQRPASVVKELVENAIDAGASRIDLVVKDAGKTLIQVIDNGCGMSDMDARMCFERHATSKISNADDLYALRTMGFRGEALASICAIAHVNLKTKRADEELGTEIVNEGSTILSQEPVMCSNGTSISVKNLFYNVPARRNFLGKDTTEYRHVMEEFLRIALVNQDIEMTFHHNDEEIYHLPAQGLRQRIVQIFGKSYNQRLVPVNEETDIIRISGFVTKPEFVKTTRDQQYFFVNHRFFKDRYFNHAIINAYDGLIPSGKFPPYFLYFELAPNAIDVNVHPTKTEIKFEENQAIYAILRSAVKQALGKFNIAPTLDFERESSFETPPLKKGETVKMPEIKVNPDYNPFKSDAGMKSWESKSDAAGLESLKTMYADLKIRGEEEEASVDRFVDRENVTILSAMDEEVEVERKKPVQLLEKYILVSVKNGFLLIDQYRASCRVLFDRLMAGDSGERRSQRLVFPESMEIEKPDLPLWAEALKQLNKTGFELELNKSVLEIHAVPVDAGDKNPVKLLHEIVSSYKASEQESDLDFSERMALAMATSLAPKAGTYLSAEEMNYLVDALFACESPQVAPNGKKIIARRSIKEGDAKFLRQ